MSLKEICLKKIELGHSSGIKGYQDPGCPALGECRTYLHDCLSALAPTPSESSSKSDPSSGASSKEESDEASGTGSHSTSLNVSAAANKTDAFLDKLDLLIESGVSVAEQVKI